MSPLEFPLLLNLSLLFILLISASIFLLCFRRRPASSSERHLEPYPIIGNLPYLLNLASHMLEWSTELLLHTDDNTVTVPPFVFTANPSNIEHTAKSRFENYPRVSLFSSTLRDFLGHGILNVNGDQWKVQRKSASYEFSTKSIASFALHKVHSAINNRLLPLLREASRTRTVIDLQEVLERFAFDSICSLVLGYDPDCLRRGEDEGERLFHAFDEAGRISVDRVSFFNMWKVKKLLNVGSERRLRRSVALIHEVIDRSIQTRRKEQQRSGDGGDFLSRFVDDGSYSDEFIRDILISFLLAGRDTTPTALTWFFWLTTSSERVTGEIIHELNMIRARSGESEGEAEGFGLEEVRRMRYMHAALSEAMRLYPPVPLVPKECMEDDVLPDGTKVRKGWMVMYNAYAMARTEGIWGDECGKFRPERWLEEREEKKRSVFEYPVFHAGPRQCLGKEMAYIQMKAVAASIIEGFEVEVVEERGKPHLGMTMRMAGGLPVRVKERKERVC